MLAGLGVRDQRRRVVFVVVIHDIAAQRVEDGLALCDQPGGQGYRPLITVFLNT